jgi:hypothetical protein
VVLFKSLDLFKQRVCLFIDLIPLILKGLDVVIEFIAQLLVLLRLLDVLPGLVV